jgi:iron(III) transport system substrate-binding protein
MIRNIIAAGCLLLGATTAALSQQAPELSPAEKLYADLYKLSPEERQKRLEEGARKEGRVVIVHTLRGELGRSHLAIFRKKYPFINVQATTDIGSQDAAERLFAEETSGRHLTDVISVSLTDLSEVLRRNYVARFPTRATEAVLPQMQKFNDPQGRWSLFFWSEHGISYNSNMVPKDRAPKEWEDLCNPFFKGSVSFDPAEARFIAGLYAIMGEERLMKFMECIGKNNPIIQRGHTQRMELMLAGDHMVQGDNYLYHGLSVKRKTPSAPYEMVFTAPIIAGMGASSINRNTRNPHAAALYVDWTLSKESQEFIASRLRGPVSIKHPYLPDDITLVEAADPPKEIADRLMSAWLRLVEGKK